MTMRAPFLCLILCLPLAGCGDDGGAYPRLMPTDSLLAEPSLPDHARIAAAGPDEVRAGLEAAGAGLAASPARAAAGTGGAADLTRRAEALRKRAAALAATDPACDGEAGTAGCEDANPASRIPQDRGGTAGTP